MSIQVFWLFMQFCSTSRSSLLFLLLPALVFALLVLLPQHHLLELLLRQLAVTVFVVAVKHSGYLLNAQKTSFPIVWSLRGSFLFSICDFAKPALLWACLLCLAFPALLWTRRCFWKTKSIFSAKSNPFVFKTTNKHFQQKSTLSCS